jgi:hypothetical protein
MACLLRWSCWYLVFILIIVWLALADPLIQRLIAASLPEGTF